MTLAKLLAFTAAAGLIAASAAEAQHFEYHRTDRDHSILVEAALLLDESLQAGDEIGVFDPDGVCAGGVVIEEAGAAVGFGAWGDDVFTDMDEGFVSGDEMQFRMWDSDNDWEVVAEAQYNRGGGEWVVNGLSFVDLNYNGAPNFTHAQDSLDYGEVPVGQFRELAFNIANDGEAPLEITSAEVTGEPFSVVFPEDGMLLLPNENDLLTVTFAPQERGGYEGTLLISTNADTAAISVPLLGSGYLPAKLALDRWEIDFGAAQVDSSPRYGTGEEIVWDTLRVANEGDRDLVLSDFGFNHPEDFGLPDEFPDSLTVEPSDTMTVPIYFNPTEMGDYDSRFLFICNDADHFTSAVRLLGFGTMPIRVPDDRRATEVTGFAITSLYPNPLNSYVTIGYSVPELTTVSVEIITVAGRRVTLLQRGFQTAGEHRVVWSGMDSRGGSVASGAYLVRVSGGGDAAIARVLLQR